MGFGAFELEVLQAHNQYRARHGAPPLELDENLCRVASQWAQHLLNTNSFQHRQNNQYGENLYMASGANLNGAAAVKSWYDEIKDYNFRSPSFQSSTGHFTQVVWKGSRLLGAGIAQRGNTVYIVCNYDPPGNIMNNFRENVSPPN
ncbi:PREDICTED: Golgi-associated plant pathogenesis-related protein 1 [Drosophila arizonae]|uniref:Golgi-associated plant pathogenesis-related protein 1 n=1 Tax=Drosophila arizonae TaxID=7263 RepID=A0ABM1NZY0_DROAR|nr:PREDICTED: Golgi-associated plant pathogenesis-related protein 1 [Drosophila arizonae]